MARAIAEAFSQDDRGFASLSHADNLQDVIERLGEAIGNPITLESPEVHLIAYTRHTDDADQARQRTILKKRVPDELVRALKERGIVRRLKESARPIRVQRMADLGLGDRVAMPVRIAGQLRAVLWVPEAHRRLSEEDLDLLEHAAALCAVWMLRLDQQRETRERLHGEFLWDVLSTPQPDTDAIQQRAQGLGLELPLPFRVVITDMDEFNHRVVKETAPNELEIDAIKRKVVHLARDEALRFGLGAVWVSRSDSVILLVGRTRSHSGPPPHMASAHHPEPFTQAVRDAAHREGLTLSVAASRLGHCWSDLPAAFEEAQDSLRAGRHLGWTGFALCAENLGALARLARMADVVGMDVVRGMHAKVACLVQEEEAKTLAFPILETLETYLDCAADSRRAAEALNLHVNTLNYRIRRIVERSGLDLTNGIERLAVHLELKLRRSASTRM